MDALDALPAFRRIGNQDFTYAYNRETRPNPSTGLPLVWMWSGNTITTQSSSVASTLAALNMSA